MCAIFGAIGNFNEERLQKAFLSLAHRGPDNSYIHEEKDLFLAYHRLAIVDSQSEPLTYKNGVRVVFNGEIYNYQKLRSQLKDHSFETNGESEVLLAAYLTWGDAFIDHVEGMFALALYDEGKQTLHLFRDRMGKKPLYYYHDGQNFVFSSEIKAIVALGIKTKQSEASMLSFLSFQTALAPATFYENIHTLQAGQKLCFSKQKIDKFFYDDILPTDITIVDEVEAKQNLKSSLESSLDKRMTTEVDMGFLLSGGVDSSLLSAMAQKKSERPIETFTLGYEGESKHDESIYAQEVADFIGTKHERIVYGFEDFKRDLKDPFLYTDQPLNDPAMFPLAHLVRNIKERTDIKVLVSGEGSDELFLGYRPYRELFDVEQLSKLSKKSWLKSYFLKHPSEHREWEWYRRVLDDEILFRSSAESFTLKQKNAYLKKRVKHDSGFYQIEKYHQHFSTFGLEDPLLWYRYIDLKVHQSDYFLMKLDRVTMYHGIEARTPFLDESLVKESLAMESTLFLKNSSSKYLLKELALEYLPQSIVHRKKRGFSYPFLEWLEKLGGFQEIKQLNNKHQLFDAKALNYLLELASKGGFKQHVFGIYLLLRWIEKNA